MKRSPKRRRCSHDPVTFKTGRRFLIALVLLSWCCSAVFAGDEFAAWQALSLKYLDTKTVDLVFYGEQRESFEPRRFGGYLLSQQMKFPLHPNLKGGINYTYIGSRTKKSDELMTTQRAELDHRPAGF